MRHLYHRHPKALGTFPAPTRGRMIRWATFYDPFVSLLTLGKRAQLRRTTVALAQLRSGEQVLEVGCGTGDVALVAYGQVGATGTVTGIDPAPEMIAVARTKATRTAKPVNFQVGVIEALAFPDATFDVVLSSLMMHHLPDDLKRQGLSEIARVLKPGGRLVVVDMKRPVGKLGHILTALALHGNLNNGIEDLLPLLSTLGFTGIDRGSTAFRLLGFVRAHTLD